MSHTPGPWTVLDHTKEPPTQEILCIPETGFALECEPFESISDTDRANAILHAAAPELLEALQDIVNEMAIINDNGKRVTAKIEWSYLIAARDAIKKARGKA